MKLNKFLLPFILLLLGIVFYFSFNFTFTSVSNNLLQQQVEMSKSQANLISNLLATRLENGISKNAVASELQKSIENFNTENSFVCMFDNTGKEICHPNKEKIGKILTENNSVIQLGSNFEIENNFKSAIINKKSTGGIRKMKNHTEIVYLSPVRNSDWIIASHSNIEKEKILINKLKEKLLFTFIILWLLSSLLIFYFLNLINKRNLKEISENNKTISEKYFNELKTIQTKFITPEKKQIERLLADKGTKLSPVVINNIAYVFTQNRITYIVEHNGEKSTINLTLDELFKTFNENKFYRVSRQVILSAKSIDKIEKYGNTQLKVLTDPPSPIDIIISKAKLTEFKKWVGKN